MTTPSEAARAAFVAPSIAAPSFLARRGTAIHHSQTRGGALLAAGRRAPPPQLAPGAAAAGPRATLGFGFSAPSQRDGARSKALPDPETMCACGSEKAYGKCCRRFHTAQGSPQVAEDLLRSRYSAYAYRLPSYIMKTTHSSLAELDRRKWKREIMEFSQEYQFVGGVDVIEQQNPGPNKTRILFRANLLERTAPVSFVEMSTFVRERNIWYYKSGKLVDVDDEG